MEVRIKEKEMELLLNDLLDVHGYDFTSYSKASLTRRINRLISVDKFPSFAEFWFKVKHDTGYLKRFIEEITVNVTEMFRDPSFYAALRSKILPQMATRPFIRVWHAGCATGEEVYSLAILLHEANLLNKSLLYATDINPDVLEEAGKGIFTLGYMKQYSENYIESGGRADFSSYYTAKYDRVIFNDMFRKRMIFSTHNLVSDSSFNEFQLILCRNVLIYFDKDLQQKVFRLFDASLERMGYLALGGKETLRFSDIAKKYQQVDNEKIWKKLK